MRPAEVDCLVGDATKARNNLGWQAEIDFPQLVSLMVQADLEWVEGMRYRAEKRPAQGAASPALPRG
jgi:GDPmannose 4,6-dehydratase